MILSRERACRRVVGTLGLAMSLSSAASFAQDAGVWPARTVQIVVPYTPGTGADILARILGPKLAERWKIGVVTDNRAGASGNIGTDFVAKSATDGYTLLCTATSFGTNPAMELLNLVARIDLPRSTHNRSGAPFRAQHPAGVEAMITCPSSMAWYGW